MGEKREGGEESSGHTHHHHPRRKRSIDAAKGSQMDDGQPQPRSHQMKSSGRKSSLSSRIKRNSDGEILSYATLDGKLYAIGDSVYVESPRPDMPYFICTIQDFRVSKRDNVIVGVKWFYRQSEVPDSVYQLLVQDRHTENDSGIDLVTKDPVIKSRELFVSDTTENYHVSLLRGKGNVKHFKDIQNAKDFNARPDSFFYILGYNPETRRLASTQGEIRVGPSHQAVLPDLRPKVKVTGTTVTNHEELTWKPTIHDIDLKMYLQAARSMAAFVGMCDGGSPEEGCEVASKDDTTINALQCLHENDYNCGRALQSLVKHCVPRSVDKKWNDQETKMFVKGLRQYGKNFFRIRKELLPHKDRGELVEFYYYWKKSPEASGQRIYRRHRRQSVFPRIKTCARANRPPSNEFLDLSSACESDMDSDDSERDFSSYACRHCFTTTSKDWHHGSRERILLCTNCRLGFKKYGELPPIANPREPPAFMFKPVREGESYDVVRHKLRTRRQRDLVSSTLRSGRNKHCSVSEPCSPVNMGRKPNKHRNSPSTLSTSSDSSTKSSEKKIKKEPGTENLDSPSIASIKQEAPGDEEEDEDEDEEAEEEEASELRAGEPGDSAVPETEGQEADNSEAASDNDQDAATTTDSNSINNANDESSHLEGDGMSDSSSSRSPSPMDNSENQPTIRPVPLIIPIVNIKKEKIDEDESSEVPMAMNTQTSHSQAFPVIQHFKNPDEAPRQPAFSSPLISSPHSQPLVNKPETYYRPMPLIKMEKIDKQDHYQHQPLPLIKKEPRPDKVDTASNSGSPQLQPAESTPLSDSQVEQPEQFRHPMGHFRHPIDYLRSNERFYFPDGSVRPPVPSLRPPSNGSPTRPPVDKPRYHPEGFGPPPELMRTQATLKSSERDKCVKEEQDQIRYSIDYYRHQAENKRFGGEGIRQPRGSLVQGSEEPKRLEENVRSAGSLRPPADYSLSPKPLGRHPELTKRDERDIREESRASPRTQVDSRLSIAPSGIPGEKHKPSAEHRYPLIDQGRPLGGHFKLPEEKGMPLKDLTKHPDENIRSSEDKSRQRPPGDHLGHSREQLRYGEYVRPEHVRPGEPLRHVDYLKPSQVVRPGEHLRPVDYMRQGEHPRFGDSPKPLEHMRPGKPLKAGEHKKPEELLRQEEHLRQRDRPAFGHPLRPDGHLRHESFPRPGDNERRDDRHVPGRPLGIDDSVRHRHMLPQVEKLRPDDLQRPRSQPKTAEPLQSRDILSRPIEHRKFGEHPRLGEPRRFGENPTIGDHLQHREHLRPDELSRSGEFPRYPEGPGFGEPQRSREHSRPEDQVTRVGGHIPLENSRKPETAVPSEQFMKRQGEHGMPTPEPLRPLDPSKLYPVVKTEIVDPETEQTKQAVVSVTPAEAEKPGEDAEESNSEEEEHDKGVYPRMPSPDPVVVDRTDHTSSSAKFIRHWHRGHNSCSRTDMLFAPLDSSKLAAKRAKAAAAAAAAAASKEKEEKKIIKKEPVSKEETRGREEGRQRKTSGTERQATPKKPETPPMNTTADAQVTGSYGIQQPSQMHMPPPRGSPGYACYPGQDLPAMRTLSEYARPHSAVGPGNPASNLMGPDPMLQYQIEQVYAMGSREAQIDLVERELQERDIRQRDLRALQQRDLREMREMELWDREMRDRGLKPGYEQQYAGVRTSTATPLAAYPPHPHHPGEPMPSPQQINAYNHNLERAHAERHLAMLVPGPENSAFAVDRLTAERLHLERMAMMGDPRAAAAAAAAAAGRPPTPHHHSHSHSHTHVHFHPQEHIHHTYGGLLPDQPGPAVLQPTLHLPPNPLSLPQPPHPIINPGTAAAMAPPPNSIPHARMYRPPLPEALAQQIQHEHIQRQMLSERHPYPPPPR
ncbi:uncharacterized protein [Asterias amurensis]|uniref:uncharacterized protein n=1 Tax=Asterias amurensis TaxID=7602 RepID=UPI003AB144AA